MPKSLGIAIAYMNEDDWEDIGAALIAGGAVFTLFTIVQMNLAETDAGPFVAWVTCPSREEEDKVMEICNRVQRR